jgi:hypothetical protein
MAFQDRFEMTLDCAKVENYLTLVLIPSTLGCWNTTTSDVRLLERDR